jgi:hypothetical protein
MMSRGNGGTPRQEPKRKTGGKKKGSSGTGSPAGWKANQQQRRHRALAGVDPALLRDLHKSSARKTFKHQSGLPPLGRPPRRKCPRRHHRPRSSVCMFRNHRRQVWQRLNTHSSKGQAAPPRLLEPRPGGMGHQLAVVPALAALASFTRTTRPPAGLQSFFPFSPARCYRPARSETRGGRHGRSEPDR